MEIIMEKKEFKTNPLIMSCVKGNLTRDPEIATSKDGRKYAWTTIACNGINKKDDTWFPRVMFFNEAMTTAQQLKKGDFIHITRCLLSPGELNDVWTDKSGKARPQSSALMVTPQKTELGMVVPLKVIKKRVHSEQETASKPSTQSSTSAGTEKQMDLDLTEQEIMATIG